MSFEHASPQPPIFVDYQLLKPETLEAVIKSFILREGTDYGTQELTLETKVENLKKKISKKEVILVFDPNTESINCLTDNEWKKLLTKIGQNNL